MTSAIPRISTLFGWKSWAAGTALLVTLTGAASWAHPGRTDARGCHACRTNCAKWGLKTGEYHCHNAVLSPPPPPATTPPTSGSSNRSAGSASSTVRLNLQISQVLDGDTMVTSIDGRQRLLHLYDVDAPELGQPFGEGAKKYASTYLLNETAEIAVISRTSRGLWVRVSIGGQDFAKLLLDVGLAWCRLEVEDDALKKCEDVARKAKIGLWGQQQPEAPWTWRLTHGDP